MAVTGQKVALVTGAAGGIGRAVARRLAADGLRLALIDQDEAGLAELVAALEAEGMGSGSLCAAAADVSSEADVATYVAEARGLGPIGVLCNVAAILGRLDWLQEVTVEEFDRIMAVNSRGTWLNMKHACAAMIEAGDGGSVINSSANLVNGALAKFAPYIASQHAVVGLTTTGAVELAQHGIRVNAVMIGPSEAPMSEAAISQLFDDTSETPPAPLPLARRGKPEEIAEVFGFLAGDRSSFVTGARLPADGGHSA